MIFFFFATEIVEGIKSNNGKYILGWLAGCFSGRPACILKRCGLWWMSGQRKTLQAEWTHIFGCLCVCGSVCLWVDCKAAVSLLYDHRMHRLVQTAAVDYAASVLTDCPCVCMSIFLIVCIKACSRSEPSFCDQSSVFGAVVQLSTSNLAFLYYPAICLLSHNLNCQSIDYTYWLIFC